MTDKLLLAERAGLREDVPKVDDPVVAAGSERFSVGRKRHAPYLLEEPVSPQVHSGSVVHLDGPLFQAESQSLPIWGECRRNRIEAASYRGLPCGPAS